MSSNPQDSHIKTAAQLLAVNVYDVETDLNCLIGCYYNFIPEVTDFGGFFEEQDTVQIRIYEESWQDSRRFWRLASVWVKNVPVMVIQNAGREGDDWARRYIVDWNAYQDLVSECRKALQVPESDKLEADIVGIDDEIEGLLEFYEGEYRKNDYPGSSWPNLRHPKDGFDRGEAK